VRVPGRQCRMPEHLRGRLVRPQGPGAALLRYRRTAVSLEGVDLAEARRRCGFTQETIAAALGVHPASVSGWERRKFRPPEAYARVVGGLLRHMEDEW
jgi:DNA-binding transcriptional regulator YiaG